MGIADIFGFGKKEEKKKTLLKMPAEASAVRTKIEAEIKENYPNLVRYQEIVKSVRVVFAQLDAIIAQGEHAEEAVRIKEDIKKKIGQLTEKVNKNKEAAKKESDADYVANNMEYLERKGMRIQAKTLFTECLDAMEAIRHCCQEEGSKQGTKMESATGELVKAMLTLQNDYLKKHGDDKEIQQIRVELLRKIEGLTAYFEENKDRVKEHKMEEHARLVLAKIASATKKLSET